LRRAGVGGRNATSRNVSELDERIGDFPSIEMHPDEMPVSQYLSFSANPDRLGG